MFDIFKKEPIEIWSDGSSSNIKTKCTGFATILKYKNHIKEFWGGFEPPTTNQQVEVYSALNGLNHIKTIDIPIKIYSDSAYLINCMKDDWINKKWKLNGWINNQNEPVANQQLWQTLNSVAKKQLYIDWIKVKGHNDIELNERANNLAIKGRHDLEVKLGLRESKLYNQCTCKSCKNTITSNLGIFGKWEN